jgi:hypothetical protein
MANYNYSTPYKGMSGGPLPPGYLEAAMKPGENLAQGIRDIGKSIGRYVEGNQKKKGIIAMVKEYLPPGPETKTFIDGLGGMNIHEVEGAFKGLVDRHTADKVEEDRTFQNKLIGEQIKQYQEKNKTIVPESTANVGLTYAQKNAIQQQSETANIANNGAPSIDPSLPREEARRVYGDHVTSLPIPPGEKQKLLDIGKQKYGVDVSWETSDNGYQQLMVAGEAHGNPMRVFKGGTTYDSLPDETKKVADDLRSKALSEKPVAKALASRTFLGAMESIVSKIGKKDSKGGAVYSAADDIALITSFMKVLDPEGVVREGEFAMAARSGGLPEQVVNTIKKWETGERLTDSQRMNFVKTAADVFAGQLKSLDVVLDQYRNAAKERGIDQKLVMPIFEGYESDASLVQFETLDKAGKAGWKKGDTILLKYDGGTEEGKYHPPGYYPFKITE